MNTIPSATQALLQRLDEGYAGIDPDDESKPWEPFWRDLLDETIDQMAQDKTEQAA